MERHYARYYKCALQVNPYSYSKFRGKTVIDEPLEAWATTLFANNSPAFKTEPLDDEVSNWIAFPLMV